MDYVWSLPLGAVRCYLVQVWELPLILKRLKQDWEKVDKSPLVPVELGCLKKKSAEVEQPTKPKHVSDVEQGI